jgi:hypothetical protein
VSKKEETPDMTKHIKFRKPSNYDVAVAKTGVPFTYRDEDGKTFGTFILSLFNLDSKFVRNGLERFGRENKEVIDTLKDDAERGAFTFVNVCLHGWSGITDEDGKEVEFSRENAMALLYDPEEDDDALLNALVAFAKDKGNFKHDPRASKDEDAKN